ncbi:MAG: hypothetical protein WDN25_30005 [Acetobacteraceae bacterium]
MTHTDEWSKIKEAQRVSRERRDVLNRQRAAQVRVNATPQTMRKLERPVIDRLLERGQMCDSQHRAGGEISRVWISITAALFPRVSDPGGGRQHGHTEDWSASLISAYRRYREWCEEAAKVQTGHHRTLADLVFLLAVDNYGPRQIALMWHMDQRRVLHLIRTSLWRYAELAGWTDSPFLPALPVAIVAQDHSRLTAATFRG